MSQLAERLRTPTFEPATLRLEDPSRMSLSEKITLIQEHMDKNREKFKAHWGKAMKIRRQVVSKETTKKLASIRSGGQMVSDREFKPANFYGDSFSHYSHHLEENLPAQKEKSTVSLTTPNPRKQNSFSFNLTTSRPPFTRPLLPSLSSSSSPSKSTRPPFTTRVRAVEMFTPYEYSVQGPPAPRPQPSPSNLSRERQWKKLHNPNGYFRHPASYVDMYV